MKPTSHTSGNDRRFGGDRTDVRRFPVTDFQYQALNLGGRGGSCAKFSPSFRNISMDYFKKEARRSFVTEVVFFVLIVLTSTWPVLQNIRAMTELVRAFAGA